MNRTRKLKPEDIVETILLIPQRTKGLRHRVTTSLRAVQVDLWVGDVWETDGPLRYISVTYRDGPRREVRVTRTDGTYDTGIRCEPKGGLDLVGQLREAIDWLYGVRPGPLPDLVDDDDKVTRWQGDKVTGEGPSEPARAIDCGDGGSDGEAKPGRVARALRRIKGPTPASFAAAVRRAVGEDWWELRHTVAHGGIQLYQWRVGLRSIAVCLHVAERTIHLGRYGAGLAPEAMRREIRYQEIPDALLDALVWLSEPQPEGGAP